MRIEGKDFRIIYDHARETADFSGSMRMSDPAQFDGVRKFLLELYDLQAATLILDFTSLDFLNSAGISTLCKYIFTIKDVLPGKQVTIVGNGTILWQRKSFENLRKIWDRVTVRFLP